MSDKTHIEWCDSTFNPWIGCTKVGPGCDHCYAEAMMDTRIGRAKWGAGQQRQRTSAAYWRQPLKWDNLTFVQCQCGWRGELQEAKNGVCPSCTVVDKFTKARRRVFCASLADVFDNEVDPQWRMDLFALIHDCENLDFLLLTKRIGNVEKMLEVTILGLRERGRVIRPWSWPNVLLGATVVNQAEADRDIPKLLATPAAVRFLSVEPMLGEMDISGALWNFITCPNCPCPDPEKARTGLEYCCRDPDIGDPLVHWVICGGESGKDARPMHPDWARSLRDQCAAVGVPFMFKQWGAWAPVQATKESDTGLLLPNGKWASDDGQVMSMVGKKAAGRTLDGRTHDEFPA